MIFLGLREKFPLQSRACDVEAPGLRPSGLQGFWGLSLSIKIAQKPYIIGSWGPKALKYESFDAKGLGFRI